MITDAELDGGKDTPGADGVTVVGVDDGNTNANLDGAGVGVAVQGHYGKLTLGSDGSGYVRDANTPGGMTTCSRTPSRMAMAIWRIPR